ncbi:MAG: GGDEF domain-containing protein [Sulfuritalea sp.]|nr:GGDEF domain-containing protein [Sulfuritalea sp.]
MRTTDQETGTRTSFQQEELRGIARSVGEIEWLLLIVVLLYHVFGGTEPDDKPMVVLSMVIYVMLIMGFRYATFFKRESRWKLAVETWIMTGFITWALWHTGRLESPLLNCYLLVIITSSLALGKITTLLELALIAACIALLGDYSTPMEMISAKYVAGIVAVFAPFVLVAYITTMFASDIRYGLSKSELPAKSEDLTTAVNMRGFAIIADRLFGQAVRHGRPISLLVIECDNLKEVNDDLGPKAGDALLLALTKCIQEQLRHTDVLARQSGDEFVALLPETPAAGAQAAARKVRAAVVASSLMLGGELVRTSVSIGAASYPGNGDNLDLLLAHAHGNLHHVATGNS